MHTARNSILALVAVIATFGLSAHAQTEEPVAPTEQEAAVAAPETQSQPPAVDAAAEAAAAVSPDAAPETQIEPAVAAVPNSKGLDESSLSNDKGHDDYKRPLLFAPEDNGLQPDNPQIKWEIDAAGTKINLGGLKLSSSQIYLKLDQVKRSNAPDDIRASEKGPTSVIDMSFWWPAILTKDGTVSIENVATKAVTWSQDVNEDMRADWRKKLVRYKTSYLKLHQTSTWGTTDLPAKALHAFRQGAPFRVCLSKQNSEIEKLKVCSAPYSFQKLGNGRTQVAPVKQTYEATVSIKDKSIGKSGLVNAPLGKELALKIAFSDGPTIEIASQPRPLELLDVVESKDGREVVLTGRNSQPLGKKKIIERPAVHFWAPSGVEQDTVWQAALPKDAPTIRILGAFNLPFTFLFRFEKLPTENDRLFVKEASSTGTYSSEPMLFGYSTKKAKIATQEIEVEKIDDHHFEWKFGAPIQGARNRGHISLLDNEKTSHKWVAHHEYYRGYPFEASARLTGVLGSGGQLIILGEVAGSVWLETLGFQNELISRNRWGLTGRYFRALTAIESTTGQSVSDFSAMNGDLKYNLVRGIWNRDQLFGVMGSLQRVQIAGLSTNMAGVGAYWARTMPKVFADIFDKFPLLDYSKYVDVEFVYYPVAASGTVTSSTSFNLNFHGKVFWSKRLYGEAGFGIHQYGFQDTQQNTKISFGVAYGNVGMGIVF